MFTIISKYSSYYRASGVQSSTADQCAEKLDRVFGLLVSNHNVTIDEHGIHGLTPRVLTDFYIDMANRGLAMSTRNNYVAFLNPFLSWAYKNEYVEKDMSDILSFHKLPSKDELPLDEQKAKHLTQEQCSQLLASVKGRNSLRDRAIIALFLFSGLRVSELCSLTLAAVLDQPHGMVYVKRKGGKWKHTEVGEGFYPYLDAYLVTRNTEDHSQPLFITADGLPCNRLQLYKFLSKKQKKLGLPTGPHSLRHTFVTYAGNHAGAGIARDLANHKSLAVTNVYSHSTPEERRAVVDSLPWGK